MAMISVTLFDKDSGDWKYRFDIEVGETMLYEIDKLKQRIVDELYYKMPVDKQYWMGKYTVVTGQTLQWRTGSDQNKFFDHVFMAREFNGVLPTMMVIG